MPISLRRGPAFALLACGAILIGAPVHAAGPVPLAAHLAIYDLTLGDEQGTQAPADAKGMIAYQFEGSSCAGYTLNFRQVLDLQPAEGERRVSDMRSTTFESADGADFTFKSETRLIGGQTSSVVGEAQKTPASLSVALTAPDKSKVEVERKVAFPSEQMSLLVAAAEAGRHTLPMKLFDGSDTGKKVYNTLAVIGAPATTPPTDPAAQSEPLRSMRRWPTTISYFEDGKDSASPEYIISFDLYENGVSGALRLNYGDFTMNGSMSHFELLPQKSC